MIIQFSFIIISLFVICLSKSTNEALITDEQKLLRKILENYDSASRPTFNASNSVQVKFHSSLIKIHKLDEVDQVLTTNVWLEQEWKDERLSWNPKDYNGIKKLSVPCEKLWLPDIVLYNSADDFTSGYRQTKALVNPDGNVFWVPPARFRSTCKIDMTYFPFDDQTCTMKFGSWTYDGIQLDIIKRHNEVFTMDFEHGGEWQLMKVRAQKNVVSYPCCNETYPDITFTIQMRRRTSYYIFNIILPCLWLTLLSLLTFWLPPDSGEKVTLGITVLLSLSVFMLLLTEKMPATSEFVPLIGVYLTVIMATTSLSIVLTVFVLYIHHIGPNHKPIPPRIKHFFFDTLAPILGMITVRRHQLRNNVTSNPKLLSDQTETDISKMTSTKEEQIKIGYETGLTDKANIEIIIQHLHHLVEKQQEDELDKEIMIEWKFLARVLDRCLFWSFAAVAGSSTIIILLIMPMFK